MRSRQIREILHRLEKLENQYLAQENQVANLLNLFKEYHLELDRRQRTIRKLMRGATMAVAFTLGVGVPLI